MDREWRTGWRPDYSAQPLSEYLIMIRSPDDPKRSGRPKGGRKDKTPHHTFKKMLNRDIGRAITALLADGKPRTLNGISVELWDQNASVTGGTKVETVLWDLVQNMELEFTLESPVLFRRRQR
jgi:hypothetical protein